MLCPMEGCSGRSNDDVNDCLNMIKLRAPILERKKVERC